MAGKPSARENLQAGLEKAKGSLEKYREKLATVEAGEAEAQLRERITALAEELENLEKKFDELGAQKGTADEKEKAECNKSLRRLLDAVKQLHVRLDATRQPDALAVDGQLVLTQEITPSPFAERLQTTKQRLASAREKLASAKRYPGVWNEAGRALEARLLLLEVDQEGLEELNGDVQAPEAKHLSVQLYDFEQAVKKWQGEFNALFFSKIKKWEQQKEWQAEAARKENKKRKRLLAEGFDPAEESVRAQFEDFEETNSSVSVRENRRAENVSPRKAAAMVDRREQFEVEAAFPPEQAEQFKQDPETVLDYAYAQVSDVKNFFGLLKSKNSRAVNVILQRARNFHSLIEESYKAVQDTTARRAIWGSLQDEAKGLQAAIREYYEPANEPAHEQDLAEKDWLVPGGSFAEDWLAKVDFTKEKRRNLQAERSRRIAELKKERLDAAQKKKQARRERDLSEQRRKTSGRSGPARSAARETRHGVAASARKEVGVPENTAATTTGADTQPTMDVLPPEHEEFVYPENISQATVWMSVLLAYNREHPDEFSAKDLQEVLRIVHTGRNRGKRKGAEEGEDSAPFDPFSAVRAFQWHLHRMFKDYGAKIDFSKLQKKVAKQESAAEKQQTGQRDRRGAAQPPRVDKSPAPKVEQKTTALAPVTPGLISYDRARQVAQKFIALPEKASSPDREREAQLFWTVVDQFKIAEPKNFQPAILEYGKWMTSHPSEAALLHDSVMVFMGDRKNGAQSLVRNLLRANFNLVQLINNNPPAKVLAKQLLGSSWSAFERAARGAAKKLGRKEAAPAKSAEKAEAPAPATFDQVDFEKLAQVFVDFLRKKSSDLPKALGVLFSSSKAVKEAAGAGKSRDRKRATDQFIDTFRRLVKVLGLTESEAKSLLVQAVRAAPATPNPANDVPRAGEPPPSTKLDARALPPAPAKLDAAPAVTTPVPDATPLAPVAAAVEAARAAAEAQARQLAEAAAEQARQTEAARLVAETARLTDLFHVTQKHLTEFRSGIAAQANSAELLSRHGALLQTYELNLRQLAAPDGSPSSDLQRVATNLQRIENSLQAMEAQTGVREAAEQKTRALATEVQELWDKTLPADVLERGPQLGAYPRLQALERNAPAGQHQVAYFTSVRLGTLTKANYWSTVAEYQQIDKALAEIKDDLSILYLAKLSPAVPVPKKGAGIAGWWRKKFGGG